MWRAGGAGDGRCRRRGGCGGLCHRGGRLSGTGGRGGGGGWFGNRLRVVVNEEFVPARIDRGWVVAELAVHLLDQPFVLPEW